MKSNRGKLIVIEGTDCSGKETQSNLLIEKLERDNIKVFKFSFPNYDSPTGKIVGGPYLGKGYICNGWFPETAPNVDPKVSALYFAADRRYNLSIINDKLEKGINVLLDRYVYSNMAHQGGKLHTKEERNEMFEWLEKLEFGLLELPKSDIRVFIHMPYESSLVLKQNRSLKEDLDENERDKGHLISAENAYVELSDKYKFYTIECANGSNIRTIEDINEELYNYVKKQLN
jgi:dTMP kinase